MKIIVAPNAFKHSLSASHAAEAIAEGFRASRLVCACVLFPVGDGGTGTGELIVRHFAGETISFRAQDPLGRKREASYGIIAGGTAVIDLASASGIDLLEKADYDVWNASTFGTGELIVDALNRGVRRFIIGLGGSASVDAGAGMLQALGVQFLDGAGNSLAATPKGLASLTSISCAALDPRFSNSEIIVLSDVNNPLIGEAGGIRMFSAQKGATPKDIEKLEEILPKYLALLAAERSIAVDELVAGEATGAAGGATAALLAVGNAKLRAGIDEFLALTDFQKALEGADLVVTGEGALDLQTLQGKAPFGVAQKARAMGIPVIALAGMLPQTIPAALNDAFDALFAIGHKPMDVDTALTVTKENLFERAKQLGNFWAALGLDSGIK